MRWIFRTVAAGLLCSPDQRTVLKTKENCGRMLDESGVPFISPQFQNSAAVWRTHHAFSARCDREEKSTSGSDHEKGSDSKSAACAAAAAAVGEECSWAAAFLLRATAAKPCILLSAAPEYYPLRGPEHPSGDDEPPTVESEESYDARTLGTPILWEEPFVFSVECSATGASLWSGEAEWHGQRVLTTNGVFHPRSNSSGSGNRSDDSTAAAGSNEREVEGLVCISWNEDASVGTTTTTTTTTTTHAMSATMTVTVGTQAALEDYHNQSNTVHNNGGTSMLEWMRADASRRVAAEVSKTIDLKNLDRRGSVRFLPHVTLLDAGDAAQVIN